MGYLSAISAQFRNSNNSDYAFNYNMYNIRISIETIEQYLGGINWSWINGWDDEGFNEALNGSLTIHPPCKAESKKAIRDAWHNDNLYGKILAGDPGILADVWDSDPDAVRWFATLLQSVLQWSRRHSPDVASIWQQMSIKKLSWSGYKDYSKSWTED